VHQRAQPRPSFSDDEMVERETGSTAPSTNQLVEFIYRLATDTWQACGSATVCTESFGYRLG